MKNTLLRAARRSQGWKQQQLADFTELSVSTIERAERGEPISGESMQLLCTCLQKTPEQLGLLHAVHEDQAFPVLRERQAHLEIIDLPPLAELRANDVLTIYACGIAACQDLYYKGSPHHVDALLPLYSHQTALLAQQTSPLQQSAARLASQAQQLLCERATDREDFGTARQAGQQAFSYAKLAGDSNLQIAALISLANLGFHLSSAKPGCIRTYSKEALQAYQHALSLFGNNVTPCSKDERMQGLQRCMQCEERCMQCEERCMQCEERCMQCEESFKKRCRPWDWSMSTSQ